ncbi:MAG: stalk domain-containing protein [Bacillota bacterium]|jgi:hypothetical protein
MKGMKNFLLGICLLLILIYTALPAYAANIQIEVDGIAIASDVAPEMKNSRTMVPLRVISENLGTVVNWSNSEVTLSNRDVKVLLKLNNAEAVKNGKTLLLDVKPYLKNNRIMVPLRFLAEAFSYEVNYKNFVVTVDTKSQDEKISARYWLGDTGEKIVEYSLRTNKEGNVDLLNDRGETILVGFAEYNLMLNLIFAKKDGKWGLYDKTGQMIIEHMYDEISNYEMPDGNKANGFVGVKKNGLWGAIDQEGNIVIQPEFEYIELNYYEEVEPFIKVKKNGKFGYLTREGQPLVDTVWDAAFMDVLNVPEDIIFVKQGKKWGGIRVDNHKAAPVDWNLIPSEEAQMTFNN